MVGVGRFELGKKSLYRLKTQGQIYALVISLVKLQL